jgi:hypothetical protein
MSEASASAFPRISGPCRYASDSITRSSLSLAPVIRAAPPAPSDRYRSAIRLRSEIIRAYTLISFTASPPSPPPGSESSGRTPSSLSSRMIFGFTDLGRGFQVHAPPRHLGAR